MRRVTIDNKPAASTGTHRKRSPSQIARDHRRAVAHRLRLAAAANTIAQEQVRAERVQDGARSENVNGFMAASLGRRQHSLDAQKLGLRRDARNELGVSEA